MGRLSIVVAVALLAGSAVVGQERGEGPADGGSNARRRGVVIDPRKSLVVTDQAILTNFTFSRVMKQLVDQADVPGMTELLLFQQWWDSQNPRPGAAVGAESHCDDSMVVDPSTGGLVTALAGYPYDCRPDPSEGGEALRNPFLDEANSPYGYGAIALTSRFDLAPFDGAHCGEYRIIYARRSGISDRTLRNLIIFEATLPNPAPTEGLEGCYPVARFWANLTQKSVSNRAAALERLYFQGLFEMDGQGNRVRIGPVVHVGNYGNDPARGGQIRTNQFLRAEVNGSSVWTLREFKLFRTCASAGCSAVTITPVPVKSNPFGPLFNTRAGWPDAPIFESWFGQNLDGLLGDDLTGLTLGDTGRFNAAQSHSSGSSENRYLTQLGSEASRLRDMIQARLSAANSSLTVDDVVLRAQTQSCAGCHRLNDNLSIGGGLTWPASLGFVHVTERETEDGPDGTRYVISNALTTVFLPRRQAILQEFLDGHRLRRRPGQRTLSGTLTH